MKALKNRLWIAACAMLLSSSLFAASPILSFNESGAGGYVPSIVFPSSPATDPLSGITTLSWTLPFTATAGDVLLRATAASPVTQILRFDGVNRLYWFSDGSTGIVSPADVPVLPTIISPNAFSLIGANYIPAAGQPGYNSQAPGQLYQFVLVPEPGSALLCILGGGLLLMLRRRG